ncbi:MAG: peptidoglycan DD-metalloendopeptidase family protein [Bacteroidales bacterium]|jgi:murein DD-endopeptidase MepM/ murein hydrolase activator NlpD|nr:peptidoglycan DD-metalloendopeptidase family protein [Bacteroidales bacterium]
MIRWLFVIILILSAVVYNSCSDTSGNVITPSEMPAPIEDEPEKNYDSYGIDTSLYDLYSSRVRYNQFLSEILDDYNISYYLIDIMLRNSGDVFDIRKIKAGNKYTLYLSSDSLQQLDYMVYEHDIMNHFIFDFRYDTLIRKVERPSRLELKYASGTIETSLWNTMIDNGLHPVLAVELSEIYAWSVDFFGLQKGDRFKVIYEEEYIDTVSNGVYRIHAALFEHYGQHFYAIPLIQDDKESYYDLEGQSLRKAFLKAPLRYSRISSRYSNSRLHPILRIRRPHHGVDYAAPVGTPVMAIGDGRVIMREYQSGSGRIVKIRHNSVYTTAYMHLSSYGKGISVGSYVKQGDIIGYVGSSGLSTGPHLDFRFYKNGYPVDPLRVEAPPVEPVSEENKERFEKISKVMVQLLESF